MTVQKITPFLWFDHEAEDAANFYVSLFNGNPARKIESRMGNVTRYSEAGAKASGQPEGSAMTASFTLEGQAFTALNGGSHFKMSGAISFVVNCDSQEEVDYFWDGLSAGGEAGVCGWVNRDKFGVTWQVTPSIIPELLGDPDPKKSARVMQAVVRMKKLIIADLKKAYEGA